MTVIFVDGPDGVGKTGYSKHLASKYGFYRLEMRPVDDTDAIEEKSAVFNAVVRDLAEQGIDLVIDRGSVSSIVYSRKFDRGEPEHAWKTLEAVEPTIVYLRCEPKELAIRYGNNDEIFTADEVAELAEAYDEVMAEVDEETDAQVITFDTSTGVPSEIAERMDAELYGGNSQ